jgi:hypothetical protein
MAEKNNEPDVVVPTPDVVVPTPEVVVPTPEVVVPTPEVVVPTPEVVVPTPEVVVPNKEPSSPTPPEPVSPVPTPEIPKTEEILIQVAKELKSLLAGNSLTLSNITGVVVDLYNFIQCYKSLTEHQKTLLLITVLTNFVKTEVDTDPTLLVVIETLVPRIVDTLVGVSTGKINIGDIVEELEEQAKSCWNCFTSCFKKH